jgi:N6-adenosine-specific RNA methylase IME4
VRVPDHQTTVIVSDPPWPHANGSRTNSGKSPKYSLMNLREIEALGDFVAAAAGAHAVIYLWATTPHLPGAIDVLRAWGFTYRSFHIWRKTKVACGFWARSNAEIVLIGERGAPAAPIGSLLATTIVEGAPEAIGHSTKPSAIHELAERLWPNARKLELFARRRRDGWETYGSDLGHRISSSGIDDKEGGMRKATLPFPTPEAPESKEGE